jgi:hypothetical protein
LPAAPPHRASSTSPLASIRPTSGSARAANNLLIDVLGNQSTITVQDWSGTNPSAILAFIKGGDGFRIDTQIDQLVGAMAIYSANNPGFSPATAAQMPTDPTLQNALQSAWHH